ncbi:MAG: gas vesicle protein GvpH [Myxococcota bacterium]
MSDQKKGLNGLFKGLGDLVEKLSELAKEGGVIEQTRDLSSSDGLEGVMGVNVRVGLGRRHEADADEESTVRVSPIHTPKRADDQGREAPVHETREPPIDLFDEEDHLLIVAEMPGLTEEEMAIVLQEDLLTFRGSSGARRYHAEVLLPQPFETSALSITTNNGIVEVRLDKGTRNNTTTNSKEEA